MRAITIENHQLQFRTDISIPELGADEVLLQVAAAGLNRADIFQVAGKYPQPLNPWHIPGLEVAGTIVKLGKNVTGWQEGDKVCALLMDGGYAEFAVAPASLLLPAPSALSLLEAAALPEALFTVWLNIMEEAKLQAGETLLIHTGASGIGSTAIRLFSLLGYTVFATAGTEEKCCKCCEYGAKAAWIYKDPEWVSHLLSKTSREGVNIILDTLGGKHFQENINSLAYGGRLLSIAFLQGAAVSLQIGALLTKNLTFIGRTLRSQPIEKKADIARKLQEHVWPLIEEGSFRPIIDRCYPLSETLLAHDYMRSGAHSGKIMLTL